MTHSTRPRLLYLLPPPELSGPSDALAWLDDDARPLYLAIGAGLQEAPSTEAAAIFDTLLTDVNILAGYAVQMARSERSPKPELSLAPTPEASFVWVTDRMESALCVLAFRAELEGAARRGFTILARTLTERRRATTDEARAALALPRGPRPSELSPR